MTPEQISLLTAFATIITKIGTWPLGTFVAAVSFGPWIIMTYLYRSMEKRHEAVAQMYENNVKLVESYQLIASQQADTIRLATAATTELTSYLKNRTPCHTLIKVKQ